MCQHLKRAVARRALIREDPNPLPLPVKGSTPECIAWEGIAAVIPGVSVEKSGGDTKKTVGLFTGLSPLYTLLKSFPGARLSGWNEIETGPLATADRVRLRAFYLLPFIATTQ